MDMKNSYHMDEMIEDTSVDSFAPRIGRLAGTNRQSGVLVEYEGHGPYVAKLIANIDKKELLSGDNRSREVLLVFEKGDPRRPIIVGLMEDPLERLVSLEVRPEESQEVKDVLLDGKRLVLEAEDEILLKCGKASILIRKEGKIIVKGTDLLSRSSGRQRIRGASVSIN